MKTGKLTKQIVEAAVMVALATVLSLFKLVEMPYGGSVTLASMLPILIVSYRHDIKIGLMAGATYSVIQQLLGLNTLSFFTTWYSILAIILIDYILAFTVVGLGGIVKGRMGIKNLSSPAKQKVEIATGMALVCVLRFVCHTVCGATVWAGLSIPTSAALLYSIGYNATYMIPETIISVLIGAWIGEIIDFSRDIPVRFSLSEYSKAAANGDACKVLPHISSFLLVFAACFDTVLIAPHMQDGESGEFTFSNFAQVNWTLIIVVSALCIAAAAVLYAVYRKLSKDRKA